MMAKSLMWFQKKLHSPTKISPCWWKVEHHEWLEACFFPGFMPSGVSMNPRFRVAKNTFVQIHFPVVLKKLSKTFSSTCVNVHHELQCEGSHHQCIPRHYRCFWARSPSVFENWLENPEVKSPRPLPLPRIVKAVSGYDFSYSCICQNPEVRSNIKKMVEFALPTLPMHSGISFILYLSMWEWLFNSQKS